MTIKDIARISGVSITTVSRVLNNRPDVSDESRRRRRFSRAALAAQDQQLFHAPAPPFRISRQSPLNISPRAGSASTATQPAALARAVSAL